LDFVFDHSLVFAVVFFALGIVSAWATNWLGQQFGVWEEEDKNGWRDHLRGIAMFAAFFAGPILIFVYVLPDSP